MSENPFLPSFSDLPEELAIFPLPGAVLMPGVQLPLNIFEPRYLNMVQDALARDHLIGMIQPQGDIEDDPEPAIHAIGCAGRITSYSETNDGRIVLVLTGVCRFRIGAELAGRRGYRMVRPTWDRFALDYHPGDDRLADRDAFLTTLKSFCQLRGVDIPWDDVENMADTELVNLLCAHLPLGIDDKQALIETVELAERGRLMQGLMDMASVADLGATEQRH